MSGPDFQTFEAPTSASSPEAAQLFMLRRELAKVRTTTLAQVIATTASGAVGPIGLMTIKVLVSQTDGAGNLIPAGTIFNVPYGRLAGGQNAVILDPQVNDIGIVGFGDRDLSTVISTAALAGPGSNRRFSWSDALWLITLPLKVTPNQYIQFNASGISILTPQQFQATANSGGGTVPTFTMNSSGISAAFGSGSIVMNSTGITLAFGTNNVQITAAGVTINGVAINLNGPTTIDGTFSNPTGGTATFAGDISTGGKSVQAHNHQVSGIQTGGSTVTSGAMQG